MAYWKYLNGLSDYIMVRTEVNCNIEDAFNMWTLADHIKEWYFSTDDWHVTSVTSDLRIGGRLVIGMAEKNGSMSFDFSGCYVMLVPDEIVILRLDDGRDVQVHFEAIDDSHARVEEYFVPDGNAPRDMQEAGWQGIMNHFKSYAESNA